ncbi:FxSxx-COOH system tetratricopeptide repeat protein [Azospirillum tabaci]|uniref:FxSxx-COOH system tetratricopeptide repeat protein n=1 Tax=Azospirillum tabaci TaxID=2752310 RepID=UPI00166170F9|nr:FxSxx-COOH system tetratricopeptide repeat protein [Azospirillum tabaci]
MAVLFTEKFFDFVLGTLPKATLALIPEHRKKQALERLQDLNPFAVIADNHDLVRVLRVAWIEAAEHILNAGRKAAKSPEWTEVQRADIDRFHRLAINQLRAIRDATFDRRSAPGTSAIDAHLPLVVRGAAEVVSAAMGEHDDGARAVTAGFVGTLGDLVAGGNPAEVPPIFVRIAAEGLAQTGGGDRRSFGDLVFASFAETLKDPKKYPQATTAFHTATQSLTGTLVEQTLAALESVDSGLSAMLSQLDALNRLSGAAAMAVYRIEERAGQTETKVDEILTIMHSRGALQPAKQCASEASVRVIVEGLGGEGRNRAAITNVPIREPAHFLGRDDALAALQAAFGRNAGRVAITALHGLRGVGKTTLAAAYAERHRTDHRAIWWIRAGTEPGLRADLVALGLRLAWVDSELEEERAVAMVLDRVRDEGDGLLLIYDNALNDRQLSPYLPRGGAARVLITSNAPDWRRVAEPVEITVWPVTVGADYLIARTGRTGERTAAEALSDALGGLPLAHEQAAAYCERLEIALAEYHQRFAARSVAMLGDPRDAPAEYHEGRTVAATFALAIEAAAILNPAAESLIGHLALLAPEPIPLFLLREGFSSLGSPLDALLDGDGLDEAIAALRSLALVRRETIADERTPAVTTETVLVHRLVREVAAARTTADAHDKMRGGLIRALHTVYPTNLYSDPETWQRARRLDGLVMPLLDAEAGLPEHVELAVSDLLGRVASHWQVALGAYVASCSLFTRSLKIRENVLGPDHLLTALGLNNLAGLYRDLGRLDEAVPLLARVLKIREKALGPDHPDTANGLNNLATLYRDLEQLDEAVPLMARALKIREKFFGSDHNEIALGLNNLAGLYRDQRKLDEAAALFVRALKIREKALGPDHPDTATSLNNLGTLYYEQGQLDDAAPLLARALTIREKVLGPDHPNTATSLMSLAGVYRAKGQRDEAVPLLARAVVIRDAKLGPDHSSTAASLDSLGSLYLEHGRLDEAAPLLARAVVIREKALGPDHPDTATSLNNLGTLYYEQGQLDDAAPLLARALTIREMVLGPDHSDTATSLYSLGILYRSQRQRGVAAPLLVRALAIWDAKDPNHPSTAVVLDGLGTLYLEQGRLDEAAPLLTRAVVIRETKLGPDHLDTATSLNNLGMLHARQDHLDEAAQLITRALAIWIAKLGPDHSNTAAGLNNLAGLFRQQGRLDEAVPLLARALAIRETTLGPDHPDTAISLHNLGMLYEEQGRVDEAAPLLARAKAIWEKSVVPLADWH